MVTTKKTCDRRRSPVEHYLSALRLLAEAKVPRELPKKQRASLRLQKRQATRLFRRIVVTSLRTHASVREAAKAICCSERCLWRELRRQPDLATAGRVVPRRSATSRAQTPQAQAEPTG